MHTHFTYTGYMYSNGLETNLMPDTKHIKTGSKGTDYHRLRESIRNRGLVEPFVVGTKRSAQKYLLINGGATRLEIVESLYQETKDPRYRVVDCVERKPVDDLMLELSHSIQNDARRTKPFIERACALIHCVELKQEEIGEEKLTQVQAVKILRQEGYPISASLYNQMVYAVEVLLPVLPIALGIGIGRPQVERIRSLYRIGNVIWKEFGEFGTPFDQVFAEVCAATDSSDWHIDELRYQLEYEICSSCDIELQLVRLMFDVGEPELDSMIESLRQSDVQSKLSSKRRRRKKNRNRRIPSHRSGLTKVRKAPPIAVQSDSEVSTQSEFKRRQRYARKLALQLAERVSATQQIEPTVLDPIGFSVSPKSNPTDQRQEIVLAYIQACHDLVALDHAHNIKLPLVLAEINDAQWSYLRDLMNVTRALKQSLRPASVDAPDSRATELAATA